MVVCGRAHHMKLWVCVQIWLVFVACSDVASIQEGCWHKVVTA